MNEAASNEVIQVLDHGYLKKIEHWGSDEHIVEAARMSTGKGFLGWGPRRVCPNHSHSFDECATVEQGDEKLLRYLWENKHATPFEMAGMTIEVQAPIFVFREWHRHRTQSYNEMSARYTPLPDVNYVPTVDRLMTGGGGVNKQMGTVKGANEMTSDTAFWFQNQLERSYREAQDLYDKALKSGVPKELARVHLPVGRYSRMRASANLRNWLAFLTLRSTSKNQNAQWEIRQFADAVGQIVAASFPRTWGLFSETG
jgi:thymidylate synthase (FAD)